MAEPLEPRAMLAVTAADGSSGWARAFGPAEGLDTTTNYASILAVTTDASSNRYVAGDFLGTVDFDPGSAVVSRTAAVPTGFVAKFSSAGALQAVWTLDAAATSGSEAFSRVTALTTSSTGRLAVAGSFSGTFDLNPTAATLLKTAGGEDGFAMVLGSDGAWASALTTYDLDVTGYTTTVGVSSVAFASSTDIYVAGNYSYTNTADGSSGDDAYVVRIDFNPATVASGVIWEQSLGGYAAYLGGMAIDSTGLVLTATFSGSLAYVNESFPETTTDGSQGGVVAAYASDGSARWATVVPDHMSSYSVPWGDTVVNTPFPVTVSADDTTVYVATTEIGGDATSPFVTSVVRALQDSGTGQGTAVTGWSPLATSTIFTSVAPSASLAFSLYASGKKLLVSGSAITADGGAAVLLASVSTTTGDVNGSLTAASTAVSGGAVGGLANSMATIAADRQLVVVGTLTGSGSFATSADRQSLDVGTAANAFLASLSNPFVSGADAPSVALASDTGSSSTDRITKIGKLQVTGTDFGGVPQYSTNGGITWVTTFTPVAGNNSVEVRQVAAIGTSPTTSFDFTLDIVAPALPAVSLASDTGLSATDRITADGTLKVTGTEAGAVVQYSANNGTAWTEAFNPVEGSNTFLVRQADVAGNVSASATLSFTRDTTAPAAPTVSLVTDTGSSVTDRLTKIATLAVTGTETGAKVEYSADGGKNWAASVTPVEGKNTFQIRQIDIAGNPSLAKSFEFTRDTAAPTAPVISLKNDTGSSASDRITRNTELTLGAIEPGATVEYSINNGTTWTTTFTPTQEAVTALVRQTDTAGNISASSLPLAITFDTVGPAAPLVSLASDTGLIATDRISADGTLKVTGTEAGGTVEYSVNNGGTWAKAFSAIEGANSVVVRQSDLAGNVSAASTPLTFTLRTTPAAAPVVALVSDTGSSATDRLTKIAALAVTGTETGAKVEYSADDGKSWAASATPVEGKNSFQIRQIDIAGNPSLATSFEFTRDTTGPTAPVISLKNDTGSSASDRITRNAELTLDAIEPGATVEYSVNNGTTWTTTFTPTQGAVTALVRQTDTAGNISASSFPLALTFDTIAPAALAATLASDTGSSATDRITADGSLKVTGTEAGATVEYSDNNGGTWARTFSAIEGANSVVVRQADLAGNVSLASTPLTFTLRTAAAVAPVVALVSDTGSSATDRITNKGALAVTATETGAVLQYSTNGGTTWATTFTPVEGKNSVRVRQIAVSGVSPETSFEFTRDTRVPATPIAKLKVDNGRLANDKVTSNAQLSLGAIEAQATVEYSDNNGVTWTPNFLPGQGVVSALVRQTDTAGNVSGRSVRLVFTFDTTPPAIKTMTFTAGMRRVSLGFNEAVTGVKVSNFRISGMTSTGPINLPLNAPQVAKLFGTITISGTGSNRMLMFAKITRPVSGSYTLSLEASGSGITDVAGNVLAASSSTTFTG